MILSFRDRRVAILFRAGSRREAGSASRIAVRKLFMLDGADSLEALRSAPAIGLELLAGERAGQHSIRIDDAYRLCFVWTEDGAEAVEIADAV